MALAHKQFHSKVNTIAEHMVLARRQFHGKVNTIAETHGAGSQATPRQGGFIAWPRHLEAAKRLDEP